MKATSHFNWKEILSSILALGLVVGICWSLSPYLAPFFIALIAAYCFNPVVNLFQIRLKLKNRLLSIFAALLLSTGVLFLIIAISLPGIQQEFSQFQQLAKNYTENKHLPEWMPENISDASKDLLNQPFIKSMVEKLKQGSYSEEITHFFGNRLKDLGLLFSGVFNVFSFLLYFVFILIFYDEFKIKNWKHLVPKKWRAFVLKVLSDVEQEMKAYFVAQSKIVLMVSVLFAIGFKLISLPLGIGLGIIIGLLNFVPYMQLIGLLPAALLAAMYSMETNGNFWVMLGLVVLVFAIVQIIQETLIVPKVMGEYSGLNPAIILLSLSVWGGLMGIIGMMLALPLTSLIIAYYKNLVNTDSWLNNESKNNTSSA